MTCPEKDLFNILSGTPMDVLGALLVLFERRQEKSTERIVHLTEDVAKGSGQTERLTRTIRTLTYVIAGLTFVSPLAIAFSVLNPLFHWIN